MTPKLLETCVRVAAKGQIEGEDASELIAAIRADHQTNDTATAFDELQAWINRAPADRFVRRISRSEGRWSVGLQTGDEELTASRDEELRGAIRNAIMIAHYAGHK